MNSRYPNLFQPIKIGKAGLVFKNRIWSAPACPHLLQTDEVYPTDRTIAYYREKARGGSACITISGQDIDKNAPRNIYHSNFDITVEKYHRKWAQLVSAVHFFDAGISLELLAFTRHGFDENGRRILYTVSGDAQGPAIPFSEMDEMADDYANAAENAVKCGFDMIFLHFGHGVFVSQFLSPMSNRRTDEFGGCAENRARFPIMIIDRIRERIGPNIPIEVRLSGSELCEGAGTVEDCIDFLKRVEDKIDIAHISCGSFENEVSVTRTHPVEFYPEGCNVEFAAAVKASGIRIPVLTLGAFQTPAMMEETIASGKADLIAMARGTIADAARVNKARDGQEDEIIPCIKCFHCLSYDRTLEFGCSVNPTVGREAVLDQFIPPAATPKRVAVIGCGPAGMAGAIYAAKRGHQVTVYEKKDQPGGKLIFTEHASFKTDLNHFLHYEINLMEKLGVEVRLNCAPDPEEIRSEHYDAVLAAVGSVPILPPIPGISLDHVMTAQACYGHPLPAERFVIIGGGEVGCETAIYLAQERHKQVSILEMRRHLAQDSSEMNHIALNDRIRRTCSVYTDAQCSRITPTEVCFRKDGKECAIPADTVVVAAGMRALADQAEAYRGCAPVFFRLGDCKKAKNILNCTRTAFDAAMQL